MSRVKWVETTDQADLITYFDLPLESLHAYPPLQDDSPFLSGLTAAEFFTLPESEQDRIWAEAHREAERQLKNQQKQARLETLPTR